MPELTTTNITKKQALQWKQMADSAMRKISSFREQAQETMAVVVQTTEIGVAAFGMGLVAGRFGDPKLMGVPVDLGIGIALHGLGFAGIGGKYDEHMHNLGDGFLAAYLTKLGITVGDDMKKKANTTASSGWDELSSMARGALGNGNAAAGNGWATAGSQSELDSILAS